MDKRAVGETEADGLQVFFSNGNISSTAFWTHSPMGRGIRGEVLLLKMGICCLPPSVQVSRPLHRTPWALWCLVQISYSNPCLLFCWWEYGVPRKLWPGSSWRQACFVLVGVCGAGAHRPHWQRSETSEALMVCWHVHTWLRPSCGSQQASFFIQRVCEHWDQTKLTLVVEFVPIGGGQGFLLPLIDSEAECRLCFSSQQSKKEVCEHLAPDRP